MATLHLLLGPGGEHGLGFRVVGGFLAVGFRDLVLGFTVYRF